MDTPLVARLAVVALLLLTLGAGGGRREDDAFASPMPAEREAALDQYMREGAVTPASLPALGRLLNDEDSYVAGKAATALSLHAENAFALIEELIAHGSPQQRWGATIVLYKTSADITPFLPALTRQLADGEERIVLASLAALARLQSRAAPALPALQTLLTHEEASLRWAALSTLAAIGPPARSALPQIERLLDDEAVELRLAAAGAIQHIDPPAPLPREQYATYVEWLQDEIPGLMEQQHVPGVSIALIQRREIAWVHAFGVRDVRTQEPVTAQTIFEACSASKPIMALSALQLIQDKRLDLDAPLTSYLGHDYLPDQPEHRRITARMALTHRTGFPNWRAGYGDMNEPMPLLFQPGSDYRYSGEGIVFLQRAVESITSMSLARYALDALFRPLGLTHTSFVWTEAVERDLASGHREDGTFKERTRYRKANGAYSLYTTPTDYARLVLTLMSTEAAGGGTFTRESIDLMLHRQQRVTEFDPFVRPGTARSVATYRALGWSLEVTPEGDIFQHSGANSSGFRAFSQFNPQKGSGFVIFANGEGGSSLRDTVLARIGDL